ncbi:MAG: hypothetical protein JXB88_08335 [Spirochaetales bacterium]|nr:hypothetical protein [Spirochaetales bacterium]
MNSLKNLSVKELKEKCYEQTQKFYKQKVHDTKYCYELFRRCFEDDCDTALSAIYSVYKPHVWHWVKNHKYFYEIDAIEEEIVIDSMSHFIFAVRRHPFSHFPSVGALLAYWRICVNSIIMTQWRKSEWRKTIQDSNIAFKEEICYDKQIIKSAVWERIQQVLKNKDDLLLARLIYLYNMKPRHISKEYPEIWDTSNQVRVAQQRMKRKLNRDKPLYELLMDLYQ